MDIIIRRATAQFSEMMNWLNRGWRPAPQGRKCPDCGGAIWFKQVDRHTEAHRCVVCNWGQDYRVS